MSVATKLAVLIFGLFAIVSFFIICICLYLYFNTELELAFLRYFFSTLLVGAFASTVVIWRTLRESLAKRLESVNKMVLNNLYRKFADNTSLSDLRIDQIKNNRDYLKEYGRCYRIQLHPFKIEEIDRLLSLLKDSEENIQKILKLAEKEIPESVDRDLILEKLGFEPIYPLASDVKKVELYTKIASKLQSKQFRLLHNTQELLGDVKNLRNELYRNLDHFLKTNDLPLLPGYTSMIPGPT